MDWKTIGKAALASCAFFYPAYWLAMFVIRASPAFVKIAFAGERLLWLRSGPFYIAAVSVHGDAAQAFPQGLSSQPPLLTALLALSVCIAVSLLPKRFRLLSGLFLVCLGHVGISGPLGRWIFRSQSDWTAAAGSVFYFGIMLLGLWYVTSAVAVSGLTRRLLALIACVLLPMGVYLLAAARSIDVGYFSFGLGPLLFATGLVAAFRGQVSEHVQIGWRTVSAGAAASLLIASAAIAGEKYEQKSKQAARQRVMASVKPLPPDRPYPRLFFQKGVNFTAEGPVSYSPDGSLLVLDRLLKSGVNAVALVPYGFSPLGTTEIRTVGSWERDEDVEAVTALAHRRGLKVMLKPQIWVGRGWPADIHFDKPEDRARWFKQYRVFLEHYARLAAKTHTDIFCVGVEFAKMTQYEKEWRDLIAVARSIYKGPLVYGAVQGPEFETIRFWDALDYIGLNNYYPLPDDLKTDDVVRRVEAVQSRYKRPVVFTEAGFSSFKDPHRAPWDETPRQLSPEDQARCYEAILKAFYHKPYFQGIYWWKVGTNGYGGPADGSHTPWGKPAMQVVAKWYTTGGR